MTRKATLMASLILSGALAYTIASSVPSQAVPPGPPEIPTVDVKVVNDENNAVPVTVQNGLSASTQPFREGLDEDLNEVSSKFTLAVVASLADGDISDSTDLYTVPEGRRLVIEYASFEPTSARTAPDPGAAYQVRLRVLSAVKLQQISHVLGLVTPAISSTPTAGGITTAWSDGKLVRIYAGPGEELSISVGRNHDQGPLSILVILSAYLERAD